MFEKNRSGEVHIVNCLRVTLEVMKAKIIASEKSAIGVIFFGAKVTSDKSPDGVHVLFPLDSPTAKVIRQLQGMLDDLTSDEPTLFENTVGSSDNSYCPLKEAFSTCNGAFGLASSKHRPYDFRRIWLFTNDDDPIKNHPGELQGVLQVRGALTRGRSRSTHLTPFGSSRALVRLAVLQGLLGCRH
jgi:hypothetical protein